MRLFYYSRYLVILPLSCKSEISHILVLYSAAKMRSSASSKLYWASRISIPERLPNIYRSLAISWFSTAAIRFSRSNFSMLMLF